MLHHSLQLCRQWHASGLSLSLCLCVSLCARARCTDFVRSRYSRTLKHASRKCDGQPKPQRSSASLRCSGLATRTATGNQTPRDFLPSGVRRHHQLQAASRLVGCTRVGLRFTMQKLLPRLLPPRPLRGRRSKSLWRRGRRSRRRSWSRCVAHRWNVFTVISTVDIFRRGDRISEQRFSLPRRCN